MRLKKTKCLFAVILFGFSLVITSGQIFSQDDPDKKPQLKNFGFSLKKYDQQENQKPDETSQKIVSADEEAIQIKTDLVINDVSVINRQGSVIVGLGQDDFVITDNEIPQSVEMFAFGEKADVPRSIVLIIDYSGSQLPFIQNSIEAAKELVDNLPAQDRMAIVTDDVEVLANFTKDKKELKDNLDKLYGKVRLKKFGRSEPYSALLAVLNEMFDEEDLRPVVILQSDADEYFALKMDRSKDPLLPQIFKDKIFGIALKNYSFEDVVKNVTESRATIYGVLPGFRLTGISPEQQLKRMQIKDENYQRFMSQLFGGAGISYQTPKHLLLELTRWGLEQEKSLIEISRLSGAYLNYLETPADAKTVYTDIFTTINNRYVIGYYPSEQVVNAEKHTIKIEVRGHPEYIVMGRKSYQSSPNK